MAHGAGHHNICVFVVFYKRSSEIADQAEETHSCSDPDFHLDHLRNGIILRYYDAAGRDQRYALCNLHRDGTDLRRISGESPVLYAYLLTICVELLFEHGEIMVINLTNSLIAMLVGLYVSWNQSRDRFTILLYRYTEGSEEEQRVRTQMMLSQIRPHFIYNILASIQVLCLKDPQKAAGAVACFSSYLRGNMDAIGNENLVPFPYELAHVENYVTLERIRFGEKLKVCYEFEKGWDMDFDIPVLSLQPIVENAIKYGVGDKKGGGTVWISVRREGDSALVEIRDDGVGVDACNLNELPIRDDGKTHVGLHNVQARVKLMAGGSLEFFSKKDWGTIVTIKVPWRRKIHEYTGS